VIDSGRSPAWLDWLSRDYLVNPKFANPVPGS